MANEDNSVLTGDARARVLGALPLGGLTPFATLTEAQTRDILGLSTLHRIRQGGAVFEEGDRAGRFYLLLDGVVRIVRTTAEGAQVVVLHIAPGQLFGIAPALGNDSYQTTASAAAPAHVLSWPTETWDRFVRDYPAFLGLARKTIGARIGDLQQQIVDMATLRVEQRIARAIARLAERFGVETSEGVEIGFPITRQDISELTGTTLHSVSRALSTWQKAGLVRSSRARIVLRRGAALPV